ncbi:MULTISPECIES: hypothetical protein [unclassified Marinobacter]|uniref:hypothetical protein n=1 Tax=unclassified Marinobacter TaxID=83889 RepID=UPI0012682A1C|nr:MULTISPECIES: hypothetical protein [unclassified Marinobacter]QFS86641.1 hypothetical protein FIV08_07315 [Marinobacter sp. THAF197a]QFT50425.1 hypothetical protein FIU96_07245 [Marinobacter sp. THAF39]QFT52947.1 hypothetical protein FIU96_20050 [Marinobacter sp. THAF39]
MSGKYSESTVLDGITTDGVYPPVEDDAINISGDVILGFYGSFGPATVKIIFETEKPNGEMEQLPEHPDWVFTEKPGPEKFRFSKTLPFRLVVSGSDGNTNFGLNIHNLD